MVKKKSFPLMSLRCVILAGKKCLFDPVEVISTKSLTIDAGL
jgi:hypothetical protein